MDSLSRAGVEGACTRGHVLRLMACMRAMLVLMGAVQCPGCMLTGNARLHNKSVLRLTP